MLLLLDRIDRALYVFFNQTLANPLTDRVMPIITNGENWVIAVALAVLVMLWKDQRRGFLFLLGIVAVFAMCDQMSAKVLKPVFERTRPCHVVEGARALINCTHAFSFPSAHATNTFGCAVWLSYGYPSFRTVFFTLSGLVSISRVFVGVHYPFDLLAGWVLGGVIALCVIFVVEYVRRRRQREVPREG